MKRTNWLTTTFSGPFFYPLNCVPGPCDFCRIFYRSVCQLVEICQRVDPIPLETLNRRAWSWKPLPVQSMFQRVIYIYWLPFLALALGQPCIQLFRQTLTTLDLSDNSIGVQGAKDLANAIQQNKVTELVFLSHLVNFYFTCFYRH